MIIHVVVDEIIRDLSYDLAIMRVGVNFSFNDKTPRYLRYYVNINWGNVAADSIISEMIRRLEGSIQSRDKETFSNFKMVVSILSIAQGNGKTANDSKS